ncbi:shikimate dehydrogenase [Fulvivirga sp. RKSG066]|uniref:shikimate dehydrogenase family protein n=1 Tax=Fulvivirga aurantia TaxID=2529383 RepID=UPI0012BBE6DD|nr:shikimate dehydrogenase [Fulvivirga aurantia]MTI22243.1 shikimate dehydrogenase [Fulvivirga aurantia]
MPRFGLIGKKLGHSFSKKYFSEKFNNLGLEDYSYDLFELENIQEVEALFQMDNLKGFNVTVPYKELIKPHLDRFDKSAKMVGAVNVVNIENGERVGYNSDYYGFMTSLKNWLDLNIDYQALVLGSGGASKAVTSTLTKMKIPFGIISRDKTKGDLTYEQLLKNASFIQNHNLIINTTPVGMSPLEDNSPSIPYDYLNEKHWLYDLVYNPEMTLFMKKGDEQGAKTKNGLEMLHLQAEKSWEIWSKP